MKKVKTNSITPNPNIAKEAQKKGNANAKENAMKTNNTINNTAIINFEKNSKYNIRCTELCEIIQKADAEGIRTQETKEAEEELITLSRNKVTKVIRSFFPNGTKSFLVTLDDLTNIGLMEVVNAAHKYDPEKGASFKTFSKYYITRGIIREFNYQKDTITVTEHAITLSRKVSRAYYDYYMKHETTPTWEIVGEAVGISPEMAQKYMDIVPRTVDFDKPISEDGDIGYEDIIMDESAVNPEDAFINSELHDVLSNIIGNVLNETEAEVLKMSYGLDREYALTAKEIGKELRITPSKVMQIKENALRKIYKNPKARNILKRHYEPEM